MSALETVVARVLNARRSIPTQQSVLAAITGIDGCGKGFVTERIVRRLHAEGVRAAVINVDGWLNLPDRRFDPANPGEHFYLHAIRFDEMFAQAVLPLRYRRSLRCEVDYAEETATQYRRHEYHFENIDVIVVEGIFLLKREYRRHYDMSCWIDCSFDTALERAIARAQEGLPSEETVRAYRTIFFPAQEIHFQRDDPQAAATLIVNNDPRFGPVNWDEQAAG